MFPIGLNYWRDIVVGDPDWDPSSLDPGRDGAHAIDTDPAGLMAIDPDLSDFVSRGGKLLLWHGWTDGLIPPRNTIAYYEDVEATLGAEAVEDSVRLFLAPGVNHCRGGEGTSEFDPLGALDVWVADGKAPERIVASLPLPEGGRRTRPLCAYPEVARYTGEGGTDDEANFECGPPSAR